MGPSPTNTPAKQEAQVAANQSALREDLQLLKEKASQSVSNITLDPDKNSVSFTLANKTGGADYNVTITGFTGVRGGASVQVSQDGKLQQSTELDFDGRDSFPIALGAALDSTVGSVASGKRDQMLNFSNRVHDILDIREPNNLPLTPNPKNRATPAEKLSNLNMEGMRDLATRVA